ARAAEEHRAARAAAAETRTKPLRSLAPPVPLVAPRSPAPAAIPSAPPSVEPEPGAGPFVEAPVQVPASGFADGRYRVAGVERRLGEAALIGRSPQHRRIEASEVDLVAIAGSEVLSGTHLELRREGERIIAVDLGSRNGTVLVTARGRRRLRGGVAVVVEGGARLELGGDTIVEILSGKEPDT
ncbi:FHA domain-containing protein, partial [Agromyces seonyuensis]